MAYKGFQLGDKSTESVLALKATGANLIRWMIVGNINDPAFLIPAKYKAWINDELLKLDAVLPILGDTKIVIDVHTPPGGLQGSRFAMFTTNPEYQKTLIEVWVDIAKRYKNNSNVYCYGLINEPAGHQTKVKNFMVDCVKAIRQLDKRKRISVTGAYSTPPSITNCAFFKDDKYIWYETHYYDPLRLSHQGIYQYPAGIKYPTGNINKATLLNYMKPLFDFKKLHPSSRLYIGEFAISNYADVNTQVDYLTDCVNIFKELNAYWTYHAWREAPVWNKENVPEVMALLEGEFNG